MSLWAIDIHQIFAVLLFAHGVPNLRAGPALLVDPHNIAASLGSAVHFLTALIILRVRESTGLSAITCYCDYKQ